MDDNEISSQSIIKYERHEEEKNHVNLRLLHLPPMEVTQTTQPLPPTTSSLNLDKPFKMEPDTTLPEFMTTTAIPTTLLPLSPVHSQGPTDSNGSEFPHDLDFHLAMADDVRNVSSDNLKSDYDEADEALHCAKRRRRNSRSCSSRKRNSSSSTTGSACKVRIRKQITNEELQAQRNQANIRERMRTQSLNEAFQNLRQSIPTMPSDKMSKIQTLKLASDYIGFLYSVLQESEKQGLQQCQIGDTNDKNLSYYFNMWRMQDVWNTGSSKRETVTANLTTT